VTVDAEEARVVAGPDLAIYGKTRRKPIIVPVVMEV
jgi:hypothetical protein